jgi:hypothetical protein
MIKISVVLLCEGRISDGRPCLSEATAWARLGINPLLSVTDAPKGWSLANGVVLCPICAEQARLERLLATPLPDGSADPEAVKRFREWQAEQMRSVVRADLNEAKAPSPQALAHAPVKAAPDDPDFEGHVGDKVGRKVQVRVKGAFVEVTWPDSNGSSLMLRHNDFELGERPPFLDPVVYEWVRNGVRVMRNSGAVTNPEDPIAQ